jgi:hypothetical protein
MKIIVMKPWAHTKIRFYFVRIYSDNNIKHSKREKK